MPTEGEQSIRTSHCKKVVQLHLIGCYQSKLSQ